MAEQLPAKRVLSVQGQRVVTNHPLRWTVRNVETGEERQAWPVDAREMVASGEWAHVVPSDAAPEPTESQEELAPDVGPLADAEVRKAKAAEKEALNPEPRTRRQRGGA